jgi:hypothetical protein
LVKIQKTHNKVYYEVNRQGQERVALEAGAFIYLLERIEKGSHVLIASEALIYENNKSPDEQMEVPRALPAGLHQRSNTNALNSFKFAPLTLPLSPPGERAG